MEGLLVAQNNTIAALAARLDSCTAAVGCEQSLQDSGSTAQRIETLEAQNKASAKAISVLASSLGTVVETSLAKRMQKHIEDFEHMNVKVDSFRSLIGEMANLTDTKFEQVDSKVESVGKSCLDAVEKLFVQLQEKLSDLGCKEQLLLLSQRCDGLEARHSAASIPCETTASGSDACIGACNDGGNEEDIVGDLPFTDDGVNL